MKIRKRLFYLFVLLIAGLTTQQINAQTLSELLEAEADIEVAQDGSGDYTTVQAAISSITDNNDTWKVILVKKGVYEEKVVLNHLKTKVILVGEQVDSTIITWDDYGDAVLPGHTFSTYTFRADANDFQAYNITFDNPTTSGQGVAYHANGDRQILYHCRLTGNQDTYFDNFRTRRYIKDCFIEGTVDYIFGFGVTLFDSCQIHTKRKDGYITAASTPEHYEFGYVFKNCRLTSTPGLSGIYLGRPWFPYSNTTFFECWEPESIHIRGWKDWSGREATCLYKEYKCFGPGSDTTERVNFGKQLSPSLADRYNTDTILAASNFPSDLGYTVDTLELMSCYRRFEESGYADRADTILYAGRDSYPSYPTENWSPVFYSNIYDLIKAKTIPFMDSAYSELEITDIEWDGKSMEGFTSDKTSYFVELPEGQTENPVFEVIGEGVETTVNYPFKIPGNATVLATASDKATGVNYNVYISMDSAWWSCVPEYVVLDYEDTIWVQKGVEHYYSSLPLDITSVKSVKIKTQFTGQSATYTKPDQIPGDVLIKVIAPNNTDSVIYRITVGDVSDIDSYLAPKQTIYVSSQIDNSISIFSNAPISNPINFKLYDLSGKLVFEENQVNINSTKTEIHLGERILPKGIYIYNILENNSQYSGKVMNIK